MKKIYKSTLLIGISVFGIGLIAFGATNLMKGFAIDDEWPAIAIKQKEEKPDTRLIEKFIRISSLINPSTENFKMAGNITLINPLDSTQNLQNLPYVYQREGDKYYSLSGQTETLNVNELSVFVDHVQQKIMVGKNNGKVTPTVFPDLTALTKQIGEEKYRLWDRRTGENRWTISLINPTHATCKSYEIVYDSLTLRPNRVALRLSDFDDPLNNKKDKQINFEISADEQLKANLFNTERFIIKQQDGKYVLAEKYKGYELIILPELQ